MRRTFGWLFISAALLAVPLVAMASTTLKVSSSPAGAKIYLQGYYKGLTPLTVTLNTPSTTARVYKVSLLCDGYLKWTGTVSLAAGQHKSLQATLKSAGFPPATRPSTVTVSGNLSGKVICLDPGHPSETSAGTRGKRITELRANWLVALKLKTLLQALGAKVVMTKSSEGEKVTNRKRAEIANAAHANLMVRLHCDSAGGPGLAVYYPDRQGTKYGVTGPSQSIIYASRRASQAFYPVTVASLAGRVRGKGIHGDSKTYIGAQQGALTGSIFSKVPVFTVEMVVLKQSSDDAFMASESGQTAMAKAIAAGIVAALK